ncbi:MAG: serine acetyltransferase, partial [Chthoniobacterales bacterium]
MNLTSRDAVDELLQTYSETGGINYLDAAAILPSREAVRSICAELMSLMFPGFRGEALVDSGDLPDVARSRIRQIRNTLIPEICK